MRLSRINQIKKKILEENYCGTLNNQKWYKLFSYLEANNSKFKLKLLTGELLNTDFIRELANSSLLVDDSGDFIEFLEIEQLIINENNKELTDFLIGKKIDFQTKDDFILINGYIK